MKKRKWRKWKLVEIGGIVKGTSEWASLCPQRIWSTKQCLRDMSYTMQASMELTATKLPQVHRPNTYSCIYTYYRTRSLWNAICARRHLQSGIQLCPYWRWNARCELICSTYHHGSPRDIRTLSRWSIKWIKHTISAAVQEISAGKLSFWYALICSSDAPVAK